MSALKEKCASLGPREAVRQTKANGGGVTKVESSAQMPRGERQTKYVRKTLTFSQQQFDGKNNDEVLSVLCRMKEENSGFIRDVSMGRDSLSIVLASNVQLAEIKKFCTEEVMFTVMQIDPTFNLGPYECTPVSYQNLLLERKSTGKPPVFVGPVLIHYKKDEAQLQGLPEQVEIVETWFTGDCLFWDRWRNGPRECLTELLSQRRRKIPALFSPF